MAKTATLKSIAMTLDISVSTVSRVLNGKAKQHRIAISTVSRIQKEAHRVGFQVNQIASALRLNKTHTIGLVIPDISNSFFSAIARTLAVEARKQGYSLFLCDSMGDIELEKEEVRQLKARNVDGLIVSPVGSNGDHLRDLSAGGMPVVLIDRYIEGLALASVGSDNFQGAYDAVSYLIECGHQHIACLQGRANTTTCAERLRGYHRALSEHDIKAGSPSILGSDFSYDSGYESASAILKQSPEITAFFSMSNLNALGAMQAIQEAGKKIPEDISLLTFDDEALFALLATPLTAVAQPKEDIGEQAMNVLIMQIEDGSRRAEKVFLPTTRIERDSVRMLK